MKRFFVVLTILLVASNGLLAGTIRGTVKAEGIPEAKEWYEESIQSPKMNQVERDEFYYKRALERIKQDPTRFVRSMGTRFVDMWYRTESGRFEAPLLYANFTLLGLASLGLILTRKKWRMLLMFYMVILYYICLHMALTALFRYVLPIIPLLLPFAMVPFDRLFLRIKSPRI